MQNESYLELLDESEHQNRIFREELNRLEERQNELEEWVASLEADKRRWDFSLAVSQLNTVRIAEDWERYMPPPPVPKKDKAVATDTLGFTEIET